MHEVLKKMSPPDGQGLMRVINGEPCLSAAGVLCVSLFAMYDDNTPADGRAVAAGTVERLLSIARRRGFTKSDILTTLASNLECSPRMGALAQEALAGITLEDMADALGGTEAGTGQ